MGYCPAACQTGALLPNPPEPCLDLFKETTISRLMFMPCAYDLPNPTTPAAFSQLYTQGNIVFTSSLGDIATPAPNFESIKLSRCKPSFKRASSRQLTAKDLIQVIKKNTDGTITDKDFQRAFWQRIVRTSYKVRVGIAYCNGDLYVCKNDKGEWIDAEVTAYVDYQQSQNADSGKQDIELINIEVNFNDDYLNLGQRALLNLNDTSIVF